MPKRVKGGVAKVLKLPGNFEIVSFKFLIFGKEFVMVLKVFMKLFLNKGRSQ
jgi:hypothetical protein